MFGDRERLEQLLRKPPLSAREQFYVGHRKGAQVTMHLFFLVLSLIYFTTASLLVQSGASQASTIGCGRGLVFRHE